jgi:hypothetical protein
MRKSIALLIVLTGSLFTFVAGCGGKEENVVIENPPMSEAENLEEENSGLDSES